MFAKNNPTRVGRLISQPGKQLDVRWQDGTFETVLSGEYIHTTLGSSAFMRFALPEAWATGWSTPESSALNLALLLSEQKEWIDFRNLRKKAIEAGAPNSLTQQEWDRLNARLRKIPGVSPRDGRWLTWVGAESPDLLPEDSRERLRFLLNADTFVDSSGTSLAQPGVDASELSLNSGALPKQDAAALPSTEPVDKPLGSSTQHGKPKRVPARSSSKSTDKEVSQSTHLDSWQHAEVSPLPSNAPEMKAQAAPASAIDRICEEIVVSGRATPELAKELIEKPGLQLTAPARPTQTIRRAMASLQADDRWRAGTALLLAKDLVSGELLAEWATDRRSPDAVEALSRRIPSLTAAERAAALPALARASDALVDAIAPSKGQSRSASRPASLLTMPNTLKALTSGGAQILPAADRLAAAIAVALRSTKASHSEAIARLKPHIAKLPMEPDSGRFQFLVALPAGDPPVLASDWLDGIGADELVALSDADAARLTRIPSWSARIADLAEAAVAAASTRTRLLTLLASGAIATSVASTTVARALQQVGSSDSTVGSWLKLLSQQERVDELIAQGELLAADLEEARTLATAKTQAAEDASRRAVEIQNRLDAAADSHGSAHEATLRQAERDAYRLVARLLATAESEARQLDADELAARLRQVVRIQGIEPIGIRGDLLEFDPALHDAPGGRPTTGSRVRVGRPGYKWIREDDEEILVKALVAAED